MSKSVKDCLTDVFDDLDDDQFKRFKTKLVGRKEEPRVRRGAVQSADRLDVVDKLVSTFTEEDAGRVTADILISLGFTQEAGDLKSSLENVLNPSRRPAESTPDSTSALRFMVEDKHFVDFHRTQLIERLSTVEPILDRLYDKKIVNKSTYDDILAEPTPQRKMRTLYSGPLHSCGNKGKDELYLILEELEPYLMKELKNQK